MKRFLSLLALTLLAGCAVMSDRAAVKLAPGMTQDQVTAVLGPPLRTEFRTVGWNTPNAHNALVWHYRERFLIFEPIDGRVVLSAWYGRAH